MAKSVSIGKVGCIWPNGLNLGKTDSISANWLYLGKNGCIWAK